MRTTGWMYKMKGYGYKDMPILADDRAWDEAGWGRYIYHQHLHYFPPYHNRAACETTQVIPDRPVLFEITRPLTLFTEPVPKKYKKCTTCENIKRSVEKRTVSNP